MSLLLLTSLLVIAGCYSRGHDFIRPPIEQFELGKTTQGQILVAEGTPGNISHTERNGKRIERFGYQYATAAGYAVGVGPVMRTASFYFADGLLIGYLYTSSYPGESTDFDIDKASQIEKGKATRAEVVALLGKPHGVVIYPLADGEGNSELRYSFIGSGGPMGTGGIVSKDLLISVDANGIVTNVKASSEKK